MFDTSTWTNDHTMSIITIIVAVVGCVFAFIQWRRSIKLRRAEFINQIIEKLRFDPELSKAIYSIDYDQTWYKAAFHGGSENEFLVDRLLSYLSYICYLIKSGNITKAEERVFEYQILRACENKSAQAYLWNLHWWAKSRDSICSFQCLIEYGLANNKISKQDFQEQSTHYPKYLNF